MKEVSDVGAELAPSLEDLRVADLIREKSPDPDLEYLFKHALTQEVAYEGLLKRDRQQLHEQVAHAIETVLGHRSGELTETLAHHWLRAGAVEQAVTYLRLAASKAVDRYAVDEADRFYREAYDLLATRQRTAAEDRSLAETLIDWMHVYYYRGELDAGAALLVEHEAVLDRLGDPELTAMALAWRGNADWIGGRVGVGRALLDRAIEIGEREDNPTVLAHAITWKLWTLFLSARPREAVEVSARLPVLIERLDDDRYIVMKSQGALGFAYGALGEQQQALRIADDLLELGRTTGSTRALAMGHTVRALVASTAGDFADAVVEGKAGVDAATDPIYEATAMTVLLYGLAGNEDVGELNAALESARDLMSSTFGEAYRAAEGIGLMIDGQPARGIRLLASCR